ncbi:MAG TPA: protein kinase family protein [Mycobacteriales bacterium]|nr:protein kinase family protein [Mycobacteriales bacterium]
MSRLHEGGQQLDRRYRLDEAVQVSLDPTLPTAELWRATDQVLDRIVAGWLIAGQTPDRRDAVTADAGRAGQVTDARWVRILDLGSEPTGSTVTLWVITEWVHGPTLADTVAHQPLPVPLAVRLVRSCAQAVAAAHRQGVTHGGLTPDDVLLPTPDGEPRLRGLGLAPLRSGPVHDDVRGLGGLLFAAVTGRWPLEGWAGLPGAGKGTGVNPRQLRRGVGRGLDAVTAGALTGEYPDVDALLRDLTELPVAAPRPAPVPRTDRPYPAWRRWLWRLVPPLVIIGIGCAGWQIGRDVGRIPTPPQTAAPSIPHAISHSGGRHVVWRSPPRVRSFTAHEGAPTDPAALSLVVDGDPSTEWRTAPQRTATGFPGGGHGVGLLLRLRHPRPVRAAELLLSRPGSSLQIRAGSRRPQRASDLPIVAVRPGAAAAERIRLTKPVTARYWLIWFTSLPKSGRHHRLGVAEIALLR